MLEHLLSRYSQIELETYKVHYTYLKNGKSIREVMWYFNARKRIGIETDIGSGYVPFIYEISPVELKRLIARTQQGIPVDSTQKGSLYDRNFFRQSKDISK